MKRFLFVLLSTLSFSVFAQSNYTALNGPYAGGLDALVFSNSRLVGLSLGQGIVISDNAGVTWTTSNTGITDSFNLASIDEDQTSGKLYAVSSTRLYSSSDGGNTWILVSSNAFSNAKFIKVAPNGFLFIVNTSGKVYRSTNGGTSWPLGDIIDLPGSPSVRSMAIGSTGFIFIGTNNNLIYRSNTANSVIGFTQLNNTRGLTSGSIGQVSSISISGTTLYVNTQEGPYKSTNNGDTWTSIKTGISDTDFYDNQLVSTGTTVYYLSKRFNGTSGITEGTLWRSTNEGTTWTSLTHPMSIYGGTNSTAKGIYIYDTNTIYASLLKGVFKTVDGGNNWVEANTGITSVFMYDPDKLVMTDNGRLIRISGAGLGLFLSTDDGQTWDFLYNNPLNVQFVGVKKIGSTIYAYGQRIVKSTDNGGTWTTVFSGSFLGCGSYMAYFDNLNTTAFYSLATYNCTLNTPQYHLLKSADAGVTWTNNLITGLPPSANAYISSLSGIHVGSDGNVYLQLYNFSLSKYQLFKINSTTFQATDISPAGFDLSDGVTIFEDKIYVTTVTGGFKMLISTDGGQTWTQKSTPNVYGRIRVISQNTIYLLGTNASVYISTDGGDSWIDTGNFGTGKFAYDVVISPSNFAYVGINYGSVFKSNAQVIPPAAPTGLTVESFSAFFLTLKWNDNSNNESYFVIERSQGNNTAFDSVSFVNANNINNVVINNNVPVDNTTYFYRVRAVGAAGNSAYSNEASVTTLANCQNYTIPLNRSWTATTQTIAGSSNPVSITGGTGVHVISGLLNANVVSGVSPSINTSTQFQIREVCGNVYILPAGAIYGNGNSTWNAATNTLTIKWKTRPNFTPYREETTVYTLNSVDPAPTAPPNVGAYIKNTNEVVVTWGGSLYAQQYQVQRSTTPGTGFVNIGTPLTTAPFLYLDNSTLTVGTTYYYRIVATSFGGATTNSSEVSVPYQTPRFNAISLVGYDFPTQGIAWADIDNDKDDDLLITPFNAVVGATGITVFENDGLGNLTKTTVPGLSDFATSTLRVISVGDLNNDGYSDIIINGTTGGDVFSNNRDKSFTRTNVVLPNTNGFNWFASMADFNNDGRLDPVFSDDVILGSTFLRFFTQNASGEFEPYELGQIAAETGLSRAGSWVDYDKDGDQDFFRSRFGTSTNEYDQLYRNNGDGTFVAVTGSVFEQDYFMGSRSLSWGDYDNDLDLDVYVVENSAVYPSMLYRNNGDGTFTKMSSSLLAETKAVQSFGSAWGDVDNDGDLDMVVANSFQAVLYLNDGVGNFSKYTAQEYLVAQDAARTNIAFAFSDYDNNGTLDIATGKNLTNFPSIVLKNSLVPGATTRWLKIRLQGTTSNRSGIGARIEITTPNGKNQMRVIEALSGYGSTSSLTAHFGLGNQSTATVRIFWPSGIQQTMTNVAANQTLEIVEDGNAPIATTLVPANGAVNIAPTNKLEITFNEASVAIAGKRLILAKSSAPTVQIAAIDVTTAVKTGNKYEFTLASNLEFGTAYQITVEAGAFRDIYGNLTAIINPSAWSFTVAEEPDVTLPSITYDPSLANTLDKGFSPLTLNITATDNKAVTSLVFFHRKVSENNFNQVTANNTSGNNWTVQLTNAMADDMGVEYYFVASDLAGNTKRSPADADTYHKTTIKFPTASAPRITLTGGGTLQDWRIIAIPYQLAGNNFDIASVFSNFGAAGKDKWRIIRYNKTGNSEVWEDYPTFITIERGRGYFLNSIGAKEVLFADATSPDYDRGNLFTLNLSQGWNQIGNPYSVAINWEEVRTFNNASANVGVLKTFVNGQYSNGSTLQPGQGGFVNATTAVSLQIPLPGQTTGTRRNENDFSSRLGDEAWHLPLTLTHNHINNTFAAVGMHPAASLSYDEFDDVNPPRFFDYAEINFDHAEHVFKRFTRDIVPTAPDHVWEFSVNANLSGEALLTWDNTNLGNNENEIMLVDVRNMQVIDMRVSNQYTFDPKQSSDFKIYFGVNLMEKIGAETFAVASAYPNPTSKETTVRFSLPKNGGTQQQVTLEVSDAMGRTLGTVARGVFDSGYHSLSFDASTLNKHDGLLLIAVNVVNATGRSTKQVKVVVNK
ncbi:MAG: hypothetical protein EBU52_01465 [Cytophagia bacterium]|nr:hypothetical protein [Cytophagia bacterium]